MKYLKPGLILASLAVVAALPFRVHADQWDKKTIITVDQPIQVTNTYLEPGTYVFKLANSSSNRNIVMIYNRDQNHLINTIMAIPNYHIRPEGRSQFTFWETPPGTAKAVRAWFYPGDYFGQEFPYPTELKQIALATTPAPKPLAAPVPEQPAVVEPAPVPQAEVQPAPAPQEPVEIAQAAPPPPPPPAAEPAPAPAPVEQTPEELPKTASPYPLIGLGGLLTAGLWAFLRVKRLS